MIRASDFPKHEAVEVKALPKCDICVHRYGKTEDAANVAAFDAKTIMGPWAHMCPACFSDFGYGLGLGLGQRLILIKTKENA